MRQAIVHMAIAGHGAVAALSGAYEDNVASMATSRAIGYEENEKAHGPRQSAPPEPSASESGEPTPPTTPPPNTALFPPLPGHLWSQPSP